MTETRLSLVEFLDSLCSAVGVHQARKVGFAGMLAGYDVDPVVCDRCPGDEVFTFTGAVLHVTRTEREWQERFGHEDGPNAGLHKPGDLRPADPLEALRTPHPWEVAFCRHCNAEIIWADTRTGGRMAVDAEPNPAGECVLVMQDNSIERPPLVMALSEGAGGLDIKRHAPHHKSCVKEEPK